MEEKMTICVTNDIITPLERRGRFYPVFSENPGCPRIKCGACSSRPV
jgi:hypothetical protein